MKRLLSIEIQKIYYSKSARIMALVYFALLIPVLYLIKGIFESATNLELGNFGVFNFPYIWHFSTYIIQWLKILLAVVIVSMVSSEYSNRTLKQNLIDGLSKKEFIQSKFLAVLVFSGISTLIVFLTTLVLGYSYSDFTAPSIVFSDLDYLLAYFVRLTGFFTICLFVSFLMKRSAFALGILLIYWIVENALAGLIKYLAFKGNWDIAFDQIKSFFPLGSLEALIVEPITRLQIISTAGQQLGVDFSDKTYAVQYDQILICLIYIAIFIWASYALLKKRDL